jgi:pyruvate dehydrogenase E2 component (dihydrolipoamide acetyltransferase)
VPEPTPVPLPKWGMNMVEGTIVQWHKSVGEHVEAGEALVNIETDKVDTDVEAPITGTVTEILVQPGEDADVGAILCLISPDG